MNDTDLLRELSRRTGLPESAAEAILTALRDVVADGSVDAATLLNGDAAPAVALVPTPGPTLPIAKPEDPRLVDELIARARRHPLGLEFLLTGLLGSVAIALGVHAFTVEAARARLRREQQTTDLKETPAS
ncbi:MAG: hypothetical protein WA208_04015 [Thermoanaerobaculia bacterium]